MATTTNRWTTALSFALVTGLFAFATTTTGCAADTANQGGTTIGSEELVGADDSGDGYAAESVLGNVAVGATLKSTTGVNLRSGPSTSKSVLHVIPSGATVTVVTSAPSNGFYQVKHNGVTGWSYGLYFNLVSSTPTTPPPSGGGSVRDAAITRAKAGVGFSYWWGHGRFRPEGPTSANKGTCSGSCPSCSHSGSYGADCSGLVAKVWQVPSSNDDVTVDEHPYSTADFVHDTSSWKTVSRSSAVEADAMVYNNGSAGHVLVFSSGDGWGSTYAYECKGCAAGCVYNLRSVTSAYHAIRRAGW